MRTERLSGVSASLRYLTYTRVIREFIPVQQVMGFYPTPTKVFISKCFVSTNFQYTMQSIKVYTPTKETYIAQHSPAKHIVILYDKIYTILQYSTTVQYSRKDRTRQHRRAQRCTVQLSSHRTAQHKTANVAQHSTVQYRIVQNRPGLNRSIAVEHKRMKKSIA